MKKRDRITWWDRRSRSRLMAEPVGEDQWTLFEQELGDVRWYDTELTDELREVLYALLADAQAGRTATKFH